MLISAHAAEISLERYGSVFGAICDGIGSLFILPGVLLQIVFDDTTRQGCLRNIQ